jgi:hypothetical protein
MIVPELILLVACIAFFLSPEALLSPPPVFHCSPGRAFSRRSGGNGDCSSNSSSTHPVSCRSARPARKDVDDEARTAEGAALISLATQTRFLHTRINH